VGVGLTALGGWLPCRPRQYNITGVLLALAPVMPGKVCGSPRTGCDCDAPRGLSFPAACWRPL